MSDARFRWNDSAFGSVMACVSSVLESSLGMDME
jgi:hypothetical protein